MRRNRKIRFIVMMLKLCSIACVGFVLSGYSVSAQESSFLLDSVNRSFYWSDPQFTESYEMAVRNRVWLTNESKQKASILKLSQTIQKGSYQPSQGADKIKGFALATEGMTKWLNTDFWGSFSYNRVSEDSTALRHQTRRNDDAPVYFGSLKRNHYQRETYKIDGAVQHGFFNQRIPVTLSVDYRLGTHYSNNDPRGDIKDMNLQFELGLGHRLEKISYHINGIIGYGTERAKVGYKNDKYTKNTEDPLYVNWLMNGFGNAQERIKEIDYYDVISRGGGRFNVLWSPKPTHKIYVNSFYIKETQAFRKEDNSDKTYESWNDYDKDIIGIDLMWNHRINSTKFLSLSLKAQSEEGRDFNHKYMANNYVYKGEVVSLRTLYAIGRYRVSGEFKASSIDKQDGATHNNMNIIRMDIGTGVYRIFPLGDRSQLQGQICYNKQWVPEHSLIVSDLNTGNFGKEIVYQDYLYSSSSAQIWSMRWDWTVNKSHNDWSVFVDVEYQHRGELSVIEYKPERIPGRDLLNWKIGLAYIF